MDLLKTLQKYRSGRTVTVGDSTGTIEGTALMAEQWGWSPRRTKLIVILRVRLMENGRYTGKTLNVNSAYAQVVA